MSWLKSYFSNRHQNVKIGKHSSSKRPLPYRVPQGSMVGPFTFPPYTSPLAKIARKYGLSIHLYADDTQLYLSFDAVDSDSSKLVMEACLVEIRTWMAENLLKLNDSKTEYILVGSKFTLSSFGDTNSIMVGDDSITATSSVKNIGAVIDDKLHMLPHINNICKSCYLHLRHISQIRKYLTDEATTTLVHAFITSKLDNLNGLLFGLPEYVINKLQLIQNHAARLIQCKKKHESVTPILQALHWLPVVYRIQYKIMLLVYKCLNNRAPVYLSDMLELYTPARALRSSHKSLLKEPTFRTESYGRRAFSVSAPRMWNTLPQDIRSLDSLDGFKASLKTHLYRKAYPNC